MEKILLNDLNALKSLIKQLLEENEQLQAENAELRRRLGLDSTNSHKPPSSDGYAKKTVKPGVSKEGKEKRGQKGHPGQTLKRVEPDHIKVHAPGGNAPAVADGLRKKSRMRSFKVGKCSTCQTPNWK